MRVPSVSSQNHQIASPKPVIWSDIARNTTFQRPSNSSYEPKSVLDIRRSPSPAAEKPPPKTEAPVIPGVLAGDPLQLEDHVLSHFEDWDSLMRDLGLNDDSTHATKPISQFGHCDVALPDFQLAPAFDPTQFVPAEFLPSDASANHNFNPLELTGDTIDWNSAADFVDELIRLAECFETNSIELAQVILARLNQVLKSPVGRPLQRAAFYFKEALQALLTGSTRSTHPSTSSEIVQAIKAYKTFSNISPIPLFSSFTANQAILEAVDGSAMIHVIDFDIGFGGHWASFMKELADRADSRKGNPPVLRITAVVPDEYAIGSRLIRENLTQFARESKIAFDIEFVLIRTFEYLSFKAIRFVDGERIAVILSPAIFRRIGTGFVGDLRRLSPHVVVNVDAEGLMGSGTLSFRQCVIDGLEVYSTVLESLEAANAGGGGDWLRRIEMFVFLPRIFEAVEAAGNRGTPWREAFVGAGLRPLGLSQFADVQADCLLGRVQVRGFQVAKRQAELILCWHERALAATSAWRC